MYHAPVRFIFRAETFDKLYHYSEAVLVIVHKFDCLKTILKEGCSESLWMNMWIWIWFGVNTAAWY